MNPTDESRRFILAGLARDGHPQAGSIRRVLAQTRHRDNRTRISTRAASTEHAAQR